jgi:hypothetical protein
MIPFHMVTSLIRYSDDLKAIQDAVLNKYTACNIVPAYYKAPYFFGKNRFIQIPNQYPFGNKIGQSEFSEHFVWLWIAHRLRYARVQL